MATIVKRITGGASGTPVGSVLGEVTKVGGVEEEFIFEGTATQYRLAGGPAAEYSADGRWAVEPTSKAPFRSRLHVLRPAKPDAFNGTVVVTWNNVATEANMVGATPSRMIEDGFAIVGVSTQKVGIEGTAPTSEESEYFGEAIAPTPGLKDIDPERYGTLEHPGDGYSYDIYTQAAQLIGPNRTGEIDPMGGMAVKHLISMGASQSACRQSTYLNAIQPVTTALDGFLLIVSPNTPTAIDPTDAPERLPEIGPNRGVDLLGWRQYILRDDLQVPTIVLNSEFEGEQCYPNTEPETEYLRTWEFAGTSHIGLVSLEELAVIMPVELRPDWCAVSFQPTIRGAIHALHRWLDGGAPPPHQPRLVRADDPPVLVRDEHGNAVGGIRLPDLEAPLATHVGESPRGGFVQMMGRSTPFPPEKVTTLYPDQAAWFAKYAAAVDQLVAAEVILPDDAATMLAKAKAAELPI